MGLLSSIFGSHHTSQPDTSAQEAEAARQAEIEYQRLQALLDKQTELFAAQRAADQARYDAQLKAQQEEAERQRQATQAEAERQRQLATEEAARQRQTAIEEAERQRQSQLGEAERQRQSDLAEAQRQRDLQQQLADREYAAQQAQLQHQEQIRLDQEAKVEAERQAQEAQAAAHAKASRDWATGRQAKIDEGKGAIDSAYSGFNDQYFNDFAQSFVDYYRPQVKESFAAAKRDTTLGFAQSDNLRSSAAANSFGGLVKQLNQNEGKVANAATDAAQSYRDQVAQQKSDALALLYQASSAANPNVPDGVTDVDSLVSGFGSNVSGITSAAAARANTTRAPSFSAPNLDLSLNVKKPTGLKTPGGKVIA